MRSLVVSVLLVGCASDPALPPSSEISSVPSRERRTADIIESIGVVEDGTVTRADVYLGDRLGEEFSVELVDGDHLVMLVDGAETLLSRTPAKHAWETMVHYGAEVARTDLGKVAIELRRGDGSVAHSTVSIPRAFAITSVPPTVRNGDVVDIGLAPLPDHEVWGDSTIRCDDVEEWPSGSFYYAGDGSSPRAGIPKSKVPDGADWCDANLTISIDDLDGTVDPAFADNVKTTLGQQQRTTRTRYYP
jgi:hypothetical protein